MKTQGCMTYDPRFINYCKTDNERLVYSTYGECGSRVNETARRLDKDGSNVSKIIRRIQDRALLELGEMVDVGEIVFQEPKILVFDIETMYSTAAVWGFYNQNIGHANILEYGRMISFAAKWLGQEDVIYAECRGKNNKALVKKMLKLFEEADVVVGHNGRAFDVKYVQGEALKHGLEPAIPPKILDTLAVCKREFKLARNSLEFVAEHLGCTPKGKHSDFEGIELWKQCDAGNPEAWAELRRYNIQDVEVLEEVYLKLRPYATQHPNLGMFMLDGIPRCPKCYSNDLQRINDIATNTQKYDGYRCKNCGGVARGKRTILNKDQSNTLRNAV